MPDPTTTARDRVVQATVEPFRSAWGQLDESAWPKVAAALRAAASAHAEVLERFPEKAGRRHAAYRDAVAREVLPALLETLQAIEPGQVAGALLDATEARARDACGAVPETVSLPWDDRSLKGADGDTAPRRVDKLVLRIVRRVRPHRERPPVPLRAFARHVLAEEVAYPQRRAFADAQRAWAGHLGRLERAWSAWGDEFLRVRAEDDDETGDNGENGEDVRPSHAAEALQETLDALAGAPPHGEVRDRALAALAGVERTIERELPLAGTLALRPDAAPLPPRRPRDPGPSDAWTEWSAQAVARLELARALLDVLLGCAAIVDRFRTRLREGYAEELEETCARAAVTIRDLDAKVTEATPHQLPERIAEVRREAEEAIGGVLQALPAPEGFEKAVRRAGDAMAEALHALARQVPATVTVHPLPAADARPPRPGEGRTVRLQEAARQAFDVLRMERIRTQPLSLVERVSPLLGDRDRFQEVVGFGCDSAVEELEGEGEAAPEKARTLVGEGLERAAEAIAGLPAAVDLAVAETRDEIAAEVRSGWGRLVDRALAQRMQGRVMDFRSRLLETWQDTRDRLAPWAHDSSRRVRLILSRLERVASRLLRRGRTLVGANEASERTAFGTTRALAEPERLFEGLPLVYQRLFSLGPVSDPGLLAGRDAELADIESRWRRWKRREGVPMVLVGRPGAGASSFVLVALQRLESSGARVEHDTIDHRVTDEGDLAGHLAGLLGIETAGSLEALADAVLAAPEDTLPEIVALEGIEHLYLRVPGGTDLIERLLTVCAETGGRVFWLLTVTQSAWQLIRKAEPTAVAQVSAFELSALDAEGLRAAVLTRHRRSGVPISYVQPTEGRRLLRRRLRRLQGTAGHQKVLEDDFFERLHRSSGGNVRYALFEWLRAADFSSREGELRVRPLEPMDFTFLEALELTQSFTLKALLEHRTLSLDEHDRIFRIPRQESYQIFESLRNRSLIQLAGNGDAPDGGGVRSEGRWRLVPLLTGAAAAHLAQRNILH